MKMYDMSFVMGSKRDSCFAALVAPPGYRLHEGAAWRQMEIFGKYSDAGTAKELNLLKYHQLHTDEPVERPSS